MKYEELVEALRWCDASFLHECGNCLYVKYKHCKDDCMDRMLRDAAAAIGELQAQLPKQGEWIKHPEVKNIYGGEYIECPFCGEKYVVQYIADEKFCRNCGADMRKMEVQE